MHGFCDMWPQIRHMCKICICCDDLGHVFHSDDTLVAQYDMLQHCHIFCRALCFALTYCSKEKHNSCIVNKF